MKKGARARRPDAGSAAVQSRLRRAYDLMLAAHGHQHWWPGDTPFEVCVGAILTQNTAWSNVERAITNLKQSRVLSPGRLYALPVEELARLIRPAGYFNVKARRLRSFLAVLVEQFGSRVDHLFTGTTDVVRARLLAINGIGPETADSMLLYAGGHPSFVVDAYTKRIFERHHWWRGGRGPHVPKGNSRGEYADLQSLCAGALGQFKGARRLDHWQDYHAQLVVVGKDFCRPKNPRCDACPLRTLLPEQC